MSGVVVEPEVRSPSSLIGSLIDDLKPAREVFSVRLGRVQFEFRYLADGDEWASLKSSAAAWAKAVEGRGCPAALLPLRVSDRESLVWCALLGSLCVKGTRLEPETHGDGDADSSEPIPAAEWLKLAHDHALAFETVKAQVNDEITGNVRLRAAEEILASKND